MYGMNSRTVEGREGSGLVQFPFQKDVANLHDGKLQSVIVGVKLRIGIQQNKCIFISMVLKEEGVYMGHIS